jgi:uncharacterized membrane protein YcjF (UPF0283 family)
LEAIAESTLLKETAHKLIDIHFKRMDSETKTPCETDVRTAWQAESSLVQVLMFSILLVTVAITFQHLSHIDYLYIQKTWALVMAVGLSVIAVFFGIVSIFAYSSRSLKVRTGCGKESLIHRSIVVLAILLVCIEIAFMLVTFIVTATSKKSPPYNRKSGTTATASSPS